MAAIRRGTPRRYQGKFRRAVDSDVPFLLLGDLAGDAGPGQRAEAVGGDALAGDFAGALTSLGNTSAPPELQVVASVSKPIKPSTLYDLLVGIFHGRKVNRTASVDPGSSGELLGQTHPLSILIAEDNAVNQRVAKLMLQRLGYEADFAANGREAVDAVAKKTYDLVLMDMQMPELDGPGAAREICARYPAEARPRIVAMTAGASSADRDTCLAAGMDEFVTKPVRLQDLRRTLLSTTVGSQAAALPGS